MSDIAVTAEPLVIVNARVWTNDARRPWVDAVLVRGDRILAVGSSPELRKRAGRAARIVDARGRLVLPSRPDGVIATNALASLVIVDRDPSGTPRVPADASTVVFSLVEGRIECDRGTLAP